MLISFEIQILMLFMVLGSVVAQLIHLAARNTVVDVSGFSRPPLNHSIVR
jgi:hypothetical protein